MRLAEYLGTKTGQPPAEYLRYRLRRMYNIPPSVLAEQKGEFLFEMLRDLQCEKWEARADKVRQTLG